MKKEFLLSSLLTKWQNQELGHFYLLSMNQQSNHPQIELNHFIFDFLKHIYAKEKHPLIPQSLEEMDHPDLALLCPSSSHYLVDDLRPLFKALSLHRFEWRWRFIVVFDAHLIKENLANKLLKSLEEPPAYTTIFFLNPYAKKLLPTVEGRAQKIKLDTTDALPSILQESPLKSADISSYLEQKYVRLPHLLEITDLLKKYFNQEISEMSFIEKFHLRNLDHRDLLHISIDFLGLFNSTYELKDQALKEIKWFIESQNYNLNKEDRLLGLLNILSTSYQNGLHLPREH